METKIVLEWFKKNGGSDQDAVWVECYEGNPEKAIRIKDMMLFALRGLFLDGEGLSIEDAKKKVSKDMFLLADGFIHVDGVDMFFVEKGTASKLKPGESYESFKERFSQAVVSVWRKIRDRVFQLKQEDPSLKLGRAIGVALDENKVSLTI